MRWNLTERQFSVDKLGIANRDVAEALMPFLCEEAHGLCMNVGLGFGIAANIIESKCSEQTIIEKNLEVINHAKPHLVNPNVRIIFEDWRIAIHDIPEETFDFILFDPYPFPEGSGIIEDIVQDGEDLQETLVRRLKISGTFAIFRDRHLPMVCPSLLHYARSKEDMKYIGQIYRRVR